jgi:hypothetical protein
MLLPTYPLVNPPPRVALINLDPLNHVLPTAHIPVNIHTCRWPRLPCEPPPPPQVALINLDPANDVLPYTPDVDVADLVDLEAVMANLGLGPNGGTIVVRRCWGRGDR